MKIKLNKELKSTIAKAINAILKKHSKRLSKYYEIKNTIVISGVSRGGTTWLWEILLNTIPRSCGIWEPLSLNRDIVRLKQLNFSWEQYIDPKQEWKEAEILVRDILTGANINLSLIGTFPKFDFLKRIARKPETYIVKFCRVNQLLKWMIGKTGINQVILLIRHPCAVVASQLSHGSWNHLKDKASWFPHVSSEFLKKETWVKDIIKDINTFEEKLTLLWCLNYYIPLSEQMPHPWHLLTYEKLVTDSEKEIERLFQFLGREIPKEIGRYLKRPSRTTRIDSNVIQGGNRLATWKKRLNEKQQEKILSLVSKFGLDFYTDKLEPDYKRLYENPIQHNNGN